MQNGYRQKFTRLLVRKNEKARCDFNTGREIETHKKNITTLKITKKMTRFVPFVNALIITSNIPIRIIN